MKIKELRIKKGITQAELAKALGVKQTAISTYENDVDKTFSIPMLIKIADYFNVSVDYLIEHNANAMDLSNLTISQREMFHKIANMSDNEINKLEGIVATLNYEKKKEESPLTHHQQELMQKTHELSDGEIARVLGYIQSIEENPVIRKIYSDEIKN